MNAPLLEIKRLSKAFGRVIAASNIDLTIDPGVLTSIIGPNGAGKSTLINMLSGSLPVDSGRILFQGADITHLPIHHRVRMGLCRSFQVVNIFPDLTVFDNIQIPVLAVHKRARRLFRPVAREAGVREEVSQVLDRVGLAAEAQTVASALSHGDQRLLEVGIALAVRPRLLFLDEPTAGMNPVERVRVLENIRGLSEEGKTTFVIVEHDMDIVFSLSDRVVVLHHGVIIGDGTTEDIQKSARVREVYLGEEVMT
ncbi:MAG: ABC transporter ATP-binding protein [Proteobacteria bacterium]|nr:ABC transporter ATP-binding protein [Desulfobacterales bacterium]MBL7213857.1 ABC transporter ATP-binding protein [Desulfobacteraceae bacterium]MBU0736320.1 ABC transporter ATP-binding protein [Pseudomonadota bacterium]MBU1904824.1 ABC transporter ATP-binding protein [Pseudomonadota bacterium]